VSIVELSRITLLGHAAERQRVLHGLQSLGCLHLVPLAAGTGERAGGGPSHQAREALAFLEASPRRHRQVRDPARFDAEAVQAQALALAEHMRALEDERDFLVRRIADLAPWGNFDLGDLDAVGGNRLWFYLVPQYRMAEIEATDLRWALVNRDLRFCYVVVIARDEPTGMPVARTHTGPKPRRALQARLDEVEMALEDAETERFSLSRWCGLFARSLARLEERAEAEHAATLACEATPLFALQAWAPRERIDDLRGFAREHGLGLDVRPPHGDDTPPTLLRNGPATAAGEDLVTFYMTPGYWTWDPSGVVLYSFALFFAMIIADAGYAAVLAVALAGAWRGLGRSAGGRRARAGGVLLTGAAMLYGVLAGSWFGAAPPAGSLFARVAVIDVTDHVTMMAATVLLGAAHLAIANLAEARRLYPRAAALAPAGWALAIAGGTALAAARFAGAPGAQGPGEALLAGGLTLVALFSGSGGGLLARAGGGLLALSRAINAFGDVLSYLRLFALGLATAALAAAFNDMAHAVREALPGLGLLAAALVLLLGHGLNLLLGLMGALVHGLRLNLIEFFNWGLRDEGERFRPFARKEDTPWMPSS